MSGKTDSDQDNRVQISSSSAAENPKSETFILSIMLWLFGVVTRKDTMRERQDIYQILGLQGAKHRLR